MGKAMGPQGVITELFDDAGHNVKMPPFFQVDMTLPGSAEKRQGLFSFVFRNCCRSLIYLLAEESRVDLEVKASGDNLECEATVNGKPVSEIEDGDAKSLLVSLCDSLCITAEAVGITEPMSFVITVPPRSPDELLEDLSTSECLRVPSATAMAIDDIEPPVFEAMLHVKALDSLNVDLSRFEGAMVNVESLMTREDSEWTLRNGAGEFLEKLTAAFHGNRDAVVIYSFPHGDIPSPQLEGFAVVPVKTARDLKSLCNVSDCESVLITNNCIDADSWKICPNRVIIPFDGIRIPGQDNPPARRRWIRVAAESGEKRIVTIVKNLCSITFSGRITGETIE